MASKANTAFEVKNSNRRNNDMQNLPGYFGSVSEGTVSYDICSAGMICTRTQLTESEGYEGLGILNGNTWLFGAAASGSAEGRTGDHTGLYAYDAYRTNSGTDVLGNVYHIGTANTLGLELPAGERGDFCELIVGEQYKWGVGNLTAVPNANGTEIYGTIANGFITPAAAAPTDGSVYLVLRRTEDFVRGTKNPYTGYVYEVCRSAASQA